MSLLQLRIPLVLAFLCGLLGATMHFLPGVGVSQLKETIATWSRVIGGMAGLLGIYSLVHLHLGRMRKQVEGWGYSLFFFVGFLGVLVATIYNGGEWFWRDPEAGTAYHWLYRHLFTSAGATMFSVLGFFIASAAYRTFRARSASATILLVAAIVVMLGRAPLGGMITHYIPDAADWLMMVPNVAAKRGVIFGVSLGMIATSLKIIFGIERAYLGGR